MFCFLIDTQGNLFVPRDVSVIRFMSHSESAVKCSFLMECYCRDVMCVFVYAWLCPCEDKPDEGESWCDRMSLVCVCVFMGDIKKQTGTYRSQLSSFPLLLLQTPRCRNKKPGHCITWPSLQQESEDIFKDIRTALFFVSKCCFSNHMLPSSFAVPRSQCGTCCFRREPDKQGVYFQIAVSSSTIICALPFPQQDSTLGCVVWFCLAITFDLYGMQ